MSINVYNIIIEAMLDLNELERMLDESLEKETPESLKDWMMKRRVLSSSNFIDGAYECTSAASVLSEFAVSSIDRKERYNSNLRNQTSPDRDLSIAA